MIYDPKKARAHIDLFMKASALNASKWEKASGVGSGAVRKFLDGSNNSIGAPNLAKLAAGATKLLGRPIAVRDLQPDAPVSDETVTNPEPRSGAVRQRHTDAISPIGSNKNAPTLALGNRREVACDLPYYETSVGSEGGTLMDKESVRCVGRLERLTGREDVFVFHVATDEMEERFEVGELIFCERVHAKLRDYVLIEMKGQEDGKRRVLLRRLTKTGAQSITVEQLKPRREVVIKRTEVKNMWRVMRGNDLVL